MSIINEALKKAGKNLQQNETGRNHQAVKKPFLKLVFIYVLILLLSVFIGKFIFGFLSNKVQGSHTAKPVANPALPVQEPPVASITTVSQQQPKTEKKLIQPDFILNGVFVSGNDGYALINNQIVRENDTVDGASVKKITAKTAELEYGDKLITLTTGR